MSKSAAQAFADLQRLKPQAAVDYLQGRGQLTQTFSWQDLWHEEHAQQFTVSRLARLDLLKAMQDGITKSVEGDLSRRDWTRDIKSLLKKEGWWGEVEVLDPLTGDAVTTKFDSARLKLIFDTNTRMAYSAGLWERIERNKVSHPYIRYITRGDERVRESHRRLNGLTLPVDHPFWKTHWPPNGWHCRCRVMSVTQREYDQRLADGSIHIDAPVIETKQWINKRTGEITYVPVGIDPGFDYNPGMAKARVDNLQKLGMGKLKGLPAPIRQSAMTPVVTQGVSKVFSEEVTAAHAALSDATRQALAGAGYEIRVVDKIINAAPDLAAQIGQKYEQIDGLTRCARRQILIAEQALDLNTQTWRAALTGRGATVLHHEVGHALDEIYLLAGIQEIEAAWRQEAAVLTTYRARGDTDFLKEIDYFTQSWPHGLLETIAELYALRHGTGTASLLNVAATFPQTRAAFYKALEDKGL